MSELFLKILNMSICASCILLVVFLLRLLLRKAPKWTFMLLWGIAAVRLICPFSFESALSLMPADRLELSNITVSETPAEDTRQPILTGILPDFIEEAKKTDTGAADSTPTTDHKSPILTGLLPEFIEEAKKTDVDTSDAPRRSLLPIFAAIWMVGMAAMLAYMLVSYAKIKRRVGTAVLCRDNIYQSENVSSPFVLGLVHPRIYIPFGMSEQAAAYVVAHESAHIRRRDHWWKPLGFLILTLHWFNPLVWLGYALLCRDIELACDEKVIKELDRDSRADYSEVLLSYSTDRRMIAACPIAFGEVGVKKRVKTILNYKKPAFWLIIAAVVACIVLAVCFLTNQKRNESPAHFAEELGGSETSETAEGDDTSARKDYSSLLGLDASNGFDIYVCQFSQGSCYFRLLPHTDVARDWLDEELLDSKGVSAAEVRTILKTYDVDEDDIHIVLWQHPLSSYLSEWSIIREGEDTEAKRAEYAEWLKKMLFPAEGFDPTNITSLESTVSFANSYVNAYEMNKIDKNALNHAQLILNFEDEKYYPIYKFDTLDDLNAFKQQFGDELEMEHGWDEVPSFNSVTAKYDNAFFEDNSLILVYISVPNSTQRFAVESVYCDGGHFRVNITETTHSEKGDTMMSGYFVTVAVPDEMLYLYDSFDAKLQK